MISSDLFMPDDWRSLKLTFEFGSRELTIPNKSFQELPCKWLYKWVNGVVSSLFCGVITLLFFLWTPN